MAIVGTDQQDDDELRPTTSTSPNAHATLQGGNSGFAGGTGSGSGQGATTGTAATPSSGGYTNLTQYLNANQGTGATTGQAAENVVKQSGDAAMQGQNQFGEQAKNDIAGATAGLGVNQTTLSKIQAGGAGVDQKQLDAISAGGDAATGTYKGPNVTAAAYSGPTPEKVSYSGPDTSGFTSNALGLTGAGSALAGNIKNATGGQAGASALLKNAYQQPNYTVGENNLDSFLANGTSGGQAALSQAAGVGKSASDNYANIMTALNNQIDSAKKTASNTNDTYATEVADATKRAGEAQKTYDTAIKTSTDKAVADKAKADEQKKREVQAQAIIDSGQSLDDGTDIGVGGNIGGPPPVANTKTQPAQNQNAVQKVALPVISDLNSLGSNIGKIPGNVASDVKGTLAGNQKSTNNLATTVLTGGLNQVAPKTVETAASAAQKAKDDAIARILAGGGMSFGQGIQGAATKAASGVNNLGANISNTAKTAGGQISSAYKKLGFAEGGEVPSYSKILEMLKRK